MVSSGFCPTQAMVSRGGTSQSGSMNSSEEEAWVAALLEKMNLTTDEGAFATLNDDEDGRDDGVQEWALLGKVLSPSVLHISTIISVMKLPWGNPYGLKLRSVGERGENLFIAEFWQW